MGFERFHTGKDVGPVNPFRFYERYKTKKKKQVENKPAR